ncbi:LysR family transcriptional regulator [Pseudomonas sp. NFR16]|uniref:LysR family transcriptional regulator n=1 Tax=Pseudomonas sp. NFR16 TaxID=1566248 RepID=UPI0008B95C2A|nr:LysR family transcriptional regulator [Pseudomonas sp. NFR16]SEJ94877.1 DNA-binding transcriptional regulator, LysR family [Pseudomonas sp. NFR16]
MDDKKLDLNLLLALEALLAELNVTRAAKRLNLSQPALSAQLSRLRGVFGDELLIPTSRGVLPTAMALELQAPLRKTLDQMRELVSNARIFDPSTASATLTISASDYMQIAILMPFLLKVHLVAPNVKVMVRQLPDSQILKTELERGLTDIAFLVTEGLEGSELRHKEVLSERYVGIARKGSIGERPMPIDRFIQSRHIIVSPRGDGFKGATDDALAAVGLTRKVAFAVSSFMFMIEAVSQCELLAVAPQRLAERYSDRIDMFAPPVPVAGFGIAMVWHDRTHNHPARIWLRTLLEEFCAEH